MIQHCLCGRNIDTVSMFVHTTIVFVLSFLFYLTLPSIIKVFSYSIESHVIRIFKKVSKIIGIWC